MNSPKSAHPDSSKSSLAAFLGLMLVLQLAAAGGFLGALIRGELSQDTCIMLGLTLLFSTSAIFSSFTSAVSPQAARVASTMASAALALTAAVHVSHNTNQINDVGFFALNLCGQVVYVYAYFLILGQLLQLSGPWSQLPQRLAAAALLLFGGVGYLARSWVPLTSVSQGLTLTRDIILTVGPLFMALAFGYVKDLRLDSSSSINSMRLRLPSGPTKHARRRTLWIAVLGAAASLICNTAFRAWYMGDADYSLFGHVMTVFSFSWFACIDLSLDGLRTMSHEQNMSRFSATLAAPSAMRFMTRYADQRQSWAATIGLKTANFVVDHDPSGRLSAVLPASILQIRSEEIQRCVSTVLGSLELHSNAASHLVSGAIDPEPAIRPCIDALKMFACLYLDAGPLVERRITGLVSLLPIIDPGLDRVLKKVNISELIRRNQWLFHFDFDWIDQHLTHMASKARYDVQISALPTPLRSAMMDYLAKHGGIGNFVWLGPQARDRLLQEAPAMLAVIEPCPIPVGSAAGNEVLMFIVRFEQLIPRLQRFFDLDSMRQTLFDFEPSEASSRIHRLLALQLGNAQSPAEILRVLTQISSVAWRGFREKDNALQLILMAQKRLADPPESMAQALLDAVMAIGYPSQILHHAQVDKIALRDIERLKSVALSPYDPRFEEAWLVLSTTDYRRHSASQRRDFLAFLRDAAQRPRIAMQPLAQVKSIDALASLARCCDSSEVTILQDTLAALYAWLASAEAGPSTLCLLLDAHLFIRGQLHQSLTLTAAATLPLANYVARLKTQLGSGHAQIVALNARWLELGMNEQGEKVVKIPA